MLVDTPGLRLTADQIEADAIAHAQSQLGQADLVILVLDAAGDATDNQALLARFPHALPVINRCDLVQTVPSYAPALRTIATSGDGLPQLRQAIRRHFNCLDSSVVPRASWWTLEQRELLARAGESHAALQKYVEPG